MFESRSWAPLLLLSHEMSHEYRHFLHVNCAMTADNHSCCCITQNERRKLGTLEHVVEWIGHWTHDQKVLFSIPTANHG